MQKRRLKIDLSTIQTPSNFEEDDDWANHVSFILGKVVNQCLGKEAIALGLPEWTALFNELEQWKEGLPDSFHPFSPPSPNDSLFPSLWHLQGWHSTFANPYSSPAKL